MASSRKRSGRRLQIRLKPFPSEQNLAHHHAAVDADGGDHDAEQRQAISALETAPLGVKGTPRRRGPAP